MRINRNKMDEKIKKKDKDFYIGIGLCLGVAFGAAFGNIGLGISLGLVFGSHSTT